jgi:hypothetical protein
MPRKRSILPVVAVLISVLAGNYAWAAEPPEFKIVELGLGYCPDSESTLGEGIASAVGYVAPFRSPFAIKAGIAGFQFEHASFYGVCVGPRISYGRSGDGPAGPYLELTGGLYRADWGSSHILPGFQGTLGMMLPTVSGIGAELEATYTLTSDYVGFATDYTPHYNGLEQATVLLKIAYVLPARGR